MSDYESNCGRMHIPLGREAEYHKAVAAMLDRNAEMLDALKTLLAVSECADETGYVEGCGFVDIDTVQQRARDAIAKAEGRVS